MVRRQGTLETLVPDGHLARFVWQGLLTLDFSGLEAGYRSVQGGPGRPPYHPRLLAALWIYGMTQELETAAAISMACTLRDDFRWLAGGLHPSDQTLLNFLAEGEALSSIWVQVLQAMHQAGHIDLSAVAEDGTKLRANASPRSFHTAAEIDAVIEQLKVRIADRLQRLASEAVEAPQQAKAQTERRTLQQQLARAGQAAQELRERADRRAQHPTVAPPSPPGQNPLRRTAELFGRAHFRHDAERDVMPCPAGEELRCIGTYPTESGQGSYRLYGRRDCSGCSLQTQCTRGRGRRLKIPVQAPESADSADASAVTRGENAAASSAASSEHLDPLQTGPQASLTDPEAVMMLATSEKHWQPSYNADLTVTRHGVIVSQFLTKRPTDYHSFAPALAAVLSTLGRPESWIGDGHYGTQANLLLAHQKGVVLYALIPQRGNERDGEQPMTAATSLSGAPSKSRAASSSERFTRTDFQYRAEGDVMLCPAGEELHLIGTYSTESGLGSYKLYGRRNCRGCSLKDQCTSGSGRRLKVPVVHPAPVLSAEPRDADPTTAGGGSLADLVRALETRMQEIGDPVMRFRRQTVEPVNAQIKQHGVGRFHVRGLARCAVVLTLACIAHNVMKWKAREAIRAMRLAA